MRTQTALDWTAGIREAEEQRENEMIFGLWLRCHTQEQIAKDVELTQQAVGNETGELQEIEALRKVVKLPDDRTGERAYREATYGDEDWAPPLYDIWNADRNANEVKHFGNTPVECAALDCSEP